MKKIFCLILCMALFVGMLPSSFAALDNMHEKADEVLADCYAAPIFTKYQKEISEIEAAYQITIDRINRTTLSQIQNAAVDYYGAKPGYAELVDAIVLAYCDQSVFGNPEMSRPMVNEPTEVRNYKREVICSFGPRSAKYMNQAAVGISQSSSKSFLFSLSGMYKGFSLSGGFNLTGQYTLSGPPEGATLKNGLTADVRYYFAVLYGTFVHVSWDVYEIRTGKKLSHIDSYTIEAEKDSKGTPFYRTVITNVAWGSDSKIYVDAGLSNVNATGAWSNQSQLETDIKENPEWMMNGLGHGG